MEAAVRLSVDWLPRRYLPDRAPDLLDEACARARFPAISAPAARYAGLVVSALNVAEVLSNRVGVSPDVLLRHCREGA